MVCYEVVSCGDDRDDDDGADRDDNCDVGDD